MMGGVSNNGPARVTVYKGCQARVFTCGVDGNVSPDTRFWEVFDYSGRSGTITPAGAKPRGRFHLSGKVQNAMTGGLWTREVTVEAFTAGEFVSRTTTSNGNYRLVGLDAGTYQIKVRGDGICDFSGGVTLGNSAAEWNVNVAPSLANENQVRIVLTWGASPPDLDSHLRGPANCLTYYAAKQGCPGTNLDRDATGGYGPETITLTNPQPGVYRYKVHNYSRVSANLMTNGIGNQPATVTVYQGNQCTRRVFVCGVDGNVNPVSQYWEVFDYNAATKTLSQAH